jgi:replicative DNA helicase
MSKEELTMRIESLEKKIADTNYFRENALCLETKKMYEETLAELQKKLDELKEQKARFDQIQ